MRVGIVTQWYPPEPGFIPSGVAAELAVRGHEVRVLTGYPNYPQGRVYPGYRQRWNNVSSSGGVTVRRVPLYPSHDSSAVRRVGNYLSFAATSAVAGLRFLTDADVLYVYHPPATAFVGPALLRLLRRVPAVLHLQDIWPESVTLSAMAPSGTAGALMHRTIAAGMRGIYRTVAGIAVIAPSMRDRVIAQGADPAKVRVVFNWTEEELFRPVAVTEAGRREIGYRDRCTIMHAGNIGPFQNIADAVRAAATVAPTGRVDLVLVGSGIEEATVRALAERSGADNVRFLGQRPPSEMAALYAAADFQLVSLLDLPMFRGTIPSKFQAALASGSPVVVAVPGDCADLVERLGVGMSCPPQDPEALAKCFLQAADMTSPQRAALARRARNVYRATMSRSAGVAQLEDMLRSAARRRHG